MTPSAGIAALAIAIAAAAGGVAAQTMTHDHSAHAAHQGEMQNMHGPDPILTEPGQGAFAALSEVVRVLEADPKTDWSKVNLTALRDHLIDMDLLVRDAVVAQDPLDNGFRARITGDARALGAARRMVPAHADQLRADARWTVDVATQPDAVVLTVTSDDPATVARIKGLGFYGVMASQDHHRAHHYLMAVTGSMHSGH